MSLPPRRRPAPAEPARPSGIVAAVVRHRAGLATILVVAAAAAGTWLAWSRLADRLAARRDVLLLPTDVTLVGQAAWVPGDLRTRALRDASLDGGLPLDDPALAARLARAFAIHPWVREVVGVSLRHPAAATVVIRCREPVAMVAVPGGLFAVDAQGVLLPSDDFAREEADQYPRISGIATSPRTGAGAPWGDPLVTEAAAVAAVIGPEWQPLKLVACRPVPVAGGHEWELVGPNDLVVRFGSAPGLERPGEATAALKAARLRQLAGESPTGRIDVTAEEARPGPVPEAIPADPVTAPAAGSP